MAVELWEIELQPINCDCSDHECEICPDGFTDVMPASVAVTTTDEDDPRIFMVCGRHSLAELVANLS